MKLQDILINDLKCGKTFGGFFKPSPIQYVGKQAPNTGYGLKLMSESDKITD